LLTALLTTLLAALLTAGRLVILLIATWRLLAAALAALLALLTLLTRGLLSLILIPLVCHNYSSPLFSVEFLGSAGMTPQPACEFESYQPLCHLFLRGKSRGPE
jgi:hypothetical protein